jgi:hypothetical protein
MAFSIKKQANLNFKKNTTFKIPRTGFFLPSSLGGLALWLKADAGVTGSASLLNGLLAYWKLDTTGWIDSSGNGYTLTQAGTVSLGTGLIGGDAIFTGDGSNLATTTPFDFSGDFSVSIWAKIDTTNGGFLIGPTSGDQGLELYLLPLADGNFCASYGETFLATSSSAPTDATAWNHYVCTRKNESISIYLNGSLVGSGSDAIDLSGTYSFGFEATYNRSFTGSIDEAGVWNRALTVAEITSLYNAGAGKTYPFAGTIQDVTAWADQSQNGNNAIAENTPAQPTYNSNFINGKPSIDFNGIGNGNVLTIANSSSLNVSALTIFAVIQRDGDGYDNDILFIKNGNTLSDASVYGIVPFLGDPWTAWADIGSGWESLGNGFNITDNNPHIIGFSLDNTDGVAFQDGSVNTISYGVIQTSTGDLQIGGYNKSFDKTNGEHFHGKIAEFIFYDRVLTTLERQQVESYLSNKYAIQIGLNSGLLAYWKLDTTGWIDSSGNGRNLTLVGSLSNPAGLLGNSATGFSDSNYLITPSGLAPLSGKRTYSCWVYFNSNDIGYQIIWGQGGTEDYQSTYPFIIETNNQITSWFTTENGYWTNGIDSGIIPDTDVWYHLVLTFDGSIGILYVNGTSVGSSEYSGSILAPDIDRFLFGRYYTDINYNDNEFNPLALDGKLDEVGVWDRALSQQEIISLYNAGAGKTYPFN